MEFKDELRFYMRQSNLSYRKLAARSGVSAPYICRLVEGRRAVPSNEVIEKLAKGFSLPPTAFRDYKLRKILVKLREHPLVIDRLYNEFFHD